MVIVFCIEALFARQVLLMISFSGKVTVDGHFFLEDAITPALPPCAVPSERLSPVAAKADPEGARTTPLPPSDCPSDLLYSRPQAANVIGYWWKGLRRHHKKAHLEAVINTQLAPCEFPTKTKREREVLRLDDRPLKRARY